MIGTEILRETSVSRIGCAIWRINRVSLMQQSRNSIDKVKKIRTQSLEIFLIGEDYQLSMRLTLTCCVHTSKLAYSHKNNELCCPSWFPLSHHNTPHPTPPNTPYTLLHSTSM